MSQCMAQGEECERPLLEERNLTWFWDLDSK